MTSTTTTTFTFPPPVVPKDNQFRVDSLLERRKNPKTHRVEYLVHWAGYPDSYNTWEPKENIHASLTREFDNAKPAVHFLPVDTEVIYIDGFPVYSSNCHRILMEVTNVNHFPFYSSKERPEVTVIDGFAFYDCRHK